jgi:hypothetical protein
LRRLVQIIDEKARLLRLKFRESEPEGLLRFAITQDHDSMPLSEIQTLNREALLVRPWDHLLVVDFEGKDSRMTKQLRRSGGDWGFNRNRCDTD